MIIYIRTLYYTTPDVNKRQVKSRLSFYAMNMIHMI